MMRISTEVFRDIGFIRVILPFFVALISFACLSQSAQANLPSGIEVSVRSIQPEFNVREEIILDVAYTNVSDRDIKLLTWGTALEGRINEDFLSIIFEGDELPYMGMHIKRAAATPSDYVTIAPNETLGRKVDLLLGYDIDLKGDYYVEPRFASSRSNKKVESLKFKLLADRLISFKRTPTVNGCPDGVQGLPNNRFSLANSAVSAAETIALTARNTLQSTPVTERPNARRYREWFGVYNLSRWNTVQSHFNLIYSAVRNQTLVFECRDNENYFAAVFPSQPYRIFLGRAFWSAPRTGTDSKAGTIIHELSHFNILGGTNDEAYGQTDARRLAINNPAGAIQNADSHEYFAENTPFLSMPPAAPPPPPEAPDLLVKTMSLSQAEARNGGVVTVSGSVENIGNAASAATQLTIKLSNDSQIRSSDTTIAQRALGAINAGASSAFGVEVVLPDEEGRYWLGVCIVPVNGESQTANNCSLGAAIDVKRIVIIAPILRLLLDDD